MTRLQLGAALTAMFALGGVTGAAAWHALGARAAIDLFDAAHTGSRHGVFVWSLERKLDLRAEQRRAIEAILEDYDREVDALRPPVDPRVAARKEKMRADVRAALDPEQQPAFDRLIAELDKARGSSGGAKP